MIIFNVISMFSYFSADYNIHCIILYVMQKSFTTIYFSQNLLNPAADHEKSSVKI